MMPQNSSYQGNKVLLYLRSGLLFILTLLLALLVGLLVMITAPLPFSMSYKCAGLWNHSVTWLAKVLCGIDYQITGLENLPADGNAVVLCKHQSAWETIALYTILPPQVFVLKRELLHLPIWGWAMKVLKPIAINREKPKQALQQLISEGTARLNEGLWVIIFPEGTRAAPKEKLKFNAGGSLLAQRAGYPIIPIAHNAGHFWPRYSFLKYPGIIQIHIGSMIETNGRKASEINAEAEAWMTAEMQKIEST